MKKTFIVLAAVLMAMTAKAWEVGDFYDQDPTGVPAIVAYVDESGEHGLIMSPSLLSEKELASVIKKKEKDMKFQEKMGAKYAAKAGLDPELMQQAQQLAGGLQGNKYATTVEFLQHFPTFKDWKSHDKGHKEKIFKQYIDELASGNTEYGEENTKAIFEYCSANNVDLELYFPAFSYASRLGEGWFVPGNHELELISKVFVDSLGEGAKVKGSDIINKQVNLRAKLANTDAFFPIVGAISSSTMIRSGWTESNKDKISKTVSNGSEYGLGALGQLIMVAVSASLKGTYYSLLLMQKEIDKITGKQYYAFCNNYGGYIVAVKRF